MWKQTIDSRGEGAGMGGMIATATLTWKAGNERNLVTVLRRATSTRQSSINLSSQIGSIDKSEIYHCTYFWQDFMEKAS